MTTYRRRSLSLHALKRLGYEVDHRLRQNGNIVWLRCPQGREYVYKLLTMDQGDYIIVRLSPPPTAISVSGIDLAKTMGPSGLYRLIHLRMGCPGQRAMELILNGKSLVGLPANVVIPESFACPICHREKEPSLSKGPTRDDVFKTVGTRLAMDFGFYAIVSCRGFHAFLVVTEVVSNHRWVFCRQSKVVPIKLILWITRHIQYKTGNRVQSICLDGELFASNPLKTALAEAHIVAEPTGAYNSAQNGKAEVSVKLLGLIAQCLLYGAKLHSSMWCFAITYGCLLLNVRPSDVTDGKTPHEMFFRQLPNVSRAVIFGSPIHVKVRRSTRQRPDPHTIIGTFVGFQGTAKNYQYIGSTGRVQYATHAVVDELGVHNDPQHRTIAAKMLLENSDPSAAHSIELRQEIQDLVPGVSPWFENEQSIFDIADILPDEDFGLQFLYHDEYSRCEIIAIDPQGTFGRLLSNSNCKRLIGQLLLSINGMDVRCEADINDCFDGYVKATHGRLSASDALPNNFCPGPILCLQLLVVKKPRANQQWVDDYFTFGAGDFAMLRSGFSVSSLTTNPHVECPRNFAQAMHDPFRGEWLEACFNHLDSCHAIGTFGFPDFPPSGVTTIPAVVVLKHVTNSSKQISERKIRVCVDGSRQVKGIDFTESFAATILAMSIKIFIAVCMHLALLIYHVDVSNAFQNTPAPPNKLGQRLWLRVFPEYMLWFRHRFPKEAALLAIKMRRHNKNDRNLAVEMFAHVQGRVDASREWGELIDKVITDPKQIGLSKNRADQCIYSGYVLGAFVILARATDDMLIGTRSHAAYQHIVKAFEKHWKIHDMDLVKYFFGLRFIHSQKCLTIDQTILVEELLESVFGKSYRLQPFNPIDIVPMLPGTKHEEDLASCTPFNSVELDAAIMKYGFKYRTLLGMFQHLCQWTRVDIQPATQRLAQYQNAPGELHFHSLLHLAKYLRSHPDLPLAFCRRPTSIPDHPLFDVSSVAGAGCWLGEPTVSNVEAHQFPGNETFWNETRTVGALTHSLSLEALKSSEEKHFCSLAPTTEGQVDANF